MPTLEIGTHTWSLDLKWPHSYPFCSPQKTFSHWHPLELLVVGCHCKQWWHLSYLITLWVSTVVSSS